MPEFEAIKIWFVGGLFWGGLRGDGTPNYVKIIISSISTVDIKKTGTKN